jgi:hypothetical protein
MENYGLIPANPLRLSSVKASMTLLENLVTSEGFHILFHRPTPVLSPTLKFEDGKERILDVYELLTGDGKNFSLFVDIYNDENIWVPPAGFMFEFDLLNYDDDEIEVKIEQKYIFDCELIDLDIFDYYERNKKFDVEKILSGSWGVNFKVRDFPEGLIEKYKSQNSR